MKKLLVCVCLISLTLFITSPLIAGGIDNKTNWSVEYVRSLNRNAATQGADIVLYNPAGTAKMEDGLYGNLSLHYIKKEYNNQINNVDRESDEPSIIPGLFGVYKKNQWSFFGGISNHGGGGFVEFKKGTQSTNTYKYALLAGTPISPGLGTGDESLKAESYYIGYTVGGSYQFNDVFALSLAARYIQADREADGHVQYLFLPGSPLAGTTMTEFFDYEQSANGWGGVIGVNISPGDKWNIGLRYESKVELEFKYKVKRDSMGLLAGAGITSGSKVQRDLPAIFGAGVSYKFSPNFRMETNLTWYFNKGADWGGDEDDVDDGYDLGLMAEYRFNENWLATLGYLFTVTGMDPEYMTPEAPELDAHTIGAGFAWQATKGLTVNFALGNSFYVSDSFTFTAGPFSDKIEYEKNNLFLGVGVEYKFF